MKEQKNVFYRVHSSSTYRGYRKRYPLTSKSVIRLPLTNDK